MKGRYSGRHMTIYGSIMPGAISIAQSSFLTDKLTERARFKLKVLDWHRDHGKNVSLTARHYGIGRITMHRWTKQLRDHGVIGLNEQSRRPKKTRVPTTSSNTVLRIVKLRKIYPAWSKYKIKVMLQRENITTSESTIGRVFLRRGLINKKVSLKRRKAALSPKARFPRGLSISEAGDMIQIDTKYIMLPGGGKYYQFTAIDVLTKKRVLRVSSSQSSRNGARFLEECILSFPFKIHRIQTDNGAPFMKEFDQLCREKDLPHYWTHPRSPQENTYVEISHGADEREFYQQGNISSILPTMQKRVREWEDIWNNVRPHQALGYLTPNQYFWKLKTSRLATKDVIILQT